MSTVVNMSDFEDSKENFKPLKQGRSMAKFGQSQPIKPTPFTTDASAIVAPVVKKSTVAPPVTQPTLAQREKYGFCIAIVSQVIDFCFFHCSEFEEELKSYEGDDPLDVWARYEKKLAV
jgi:hypothetical protein